MQMPYVYTHIDNTSIPHISHMDTYMLIHYIQHKHHPYISTHIYTFIHKHITHIHIFSYKNINISHTS